MATAYRLGNASSQKKTTTPAPSAGIGAPSVGGSAGRGGGSRTTGTIGPYGNAAYPNPQTGAPPTMPSLPSMPGAGGGAAAPNISLTAQTYPALEALNAKYGAAADELKSDTGHFLDVAGSKIRDAREGQRRALSDSEGVRGISSSNALSNYDATTTGAVTSGLTDLAMQRENSYLGALQGQLPLATAPASLAQGEKALQLDAYRTKTAADAANTQASFNMMLALLDRQRSSPATMPFNSGASSSIYAGLR